MQIITEDSEIKSKYKEFYYHIYGKENVIFAFGNTHVIKYVSNLSKDTKCVAVIDLVYDNMDTVVAFRRIVDVCCKRKLKNVIIAPVFCSEYTELLTIREFGFVENQLVLDILDFKAPYNKLDTPYSARGIASFEKACKHMIGKARRMKFYEYAKSNIDEVSKAFLMNQGHYYFGSDLELKDSVTITESLVAKSLLYANANEFDATDFLEITTDQISRLYKLSIS